MYFLAVLMLLYLGAASSGGADVVGRRGSSTVLKCGEDPGDQLVAVVWKVHNINSSQCYISYFANKRGPNVHNDCSPRMKLTNISLTIQNTQLSDEGSYTCELSFPEGTFIKTTILQVLVPVSAPVLDVTCPQNGSTEIPCRVENGTDPSVYLTTSEESNVYNVTNSGWTFRVTVPSVSLWDSWNINCMAKNQNSERSTIQMFYACSEHSTAVWSSWGHLLSHGVVCVLYTALLIYIIFD
ncbi:immunoglobulin superfamily member 11-like [Aquarana catesbeiana]|uniref:immunoglobulin superfamily member 11-like n=1 Tax=Aquarana catesbeiana TaxID=8400 RepID=UPI003CC97A4E